MFLPKRISLVLDKLRERGFEAYVVGGAVRNAVLGLPADDYDVTTSATPMETLEAFNGYDCFTPGIKHGTVCVMIDGEMVEITSYRSDGEYNDCRHPSEVTFVKKLEEDLKRRDFTVNAMCADGNNFIDMFGGLEDCKNKIIRAIGDPDERFCEDALRILRGIRFASKLDFVIEENTKRSIHARKRLLLNVSAERLQVELTGILMGDGAENALLEYSDVIGVFVPELLPCVGFEQRSKYHAHDVYGHIARTVGAGKRDATVRMACLLHDIGKPSSFTLGEDGCGHFYGHAERSAVLAEDILRRLKFSSAFTREVVELVRHHDYPIIPKGEEGRARKLLLKALNKFGENMLRRLLDIKRADNSAKTEELRCRVDEINGWEKILDEILAEEPCFDLSALAVNGNDMLELGLKGREIGAALNYLLNEVVAESLPNDRRALLDAVKNIENKV